MTTSFRSFFGHSTVLGIVLLTACASSSPSAPDDDASSTTDDPGTTSADPETTGGLSSGDTTTGDTASDTDTNTDTDTDTDTDSDSDSTGGEVVDPSFELLVSRRDAGGSFREYRYRVLEGTADGPLVAHETANDASWSGIPISGHRAVYRASNGLQGERELRLGTLDDPLPATTIRLDVSADGSGSDLGPLMVPGDDSLLFSRDGVLYHVQLNGLAPDEPVALVDLAPPWSFSLRIAIDPQARYLVSHLPPDDEGVSNLVRVSLTDRTVEPITALDVGGTAQLPILTPSGDGAFYVTSPDGVTEDLVYVELSGDEPGPPIELLAGVAPPEQFGGIPSLGVRSHAELIGFVADVGSKDESHLSYIGVEDGIPQTPVALHDPDVSGRLVELRNWSHDGRWLVFETVDAAGLTEEWLAQFGDGHTPNVTQLDSPVGAPERFVSWWSPVNDALFTAWRSSDTSEWTIERIPLDEGESGPPSHLAGPYRSFSFQDIRQDGAMVLFAASVTEGEGLQIYGVESSGEELGRPFVLSAPLEEDEWATFASFSSDGRVVAYGERDGVSSGETRLMVAMPELPGIAAEVMDGLGGLDWVFVEPR